MSSRADTATFRVHGNTYAELDEAAAKKVLALLTGSDPSYGADYVLDISSAIETYQGPTALWQADVHVTFKEVRN